MAEHTKGPWRSMTQNGKDWSILAGNGIGKPVAITLQSIQITTDEALMNARLIAAAPELLDACVHAEVLLRRGERNNIYAQAADKCLTAIAKAEGTDEGIKEPTVADSEQ